MPRRKSLSDVARMVVDELVDPDQVGTPTTLDELLGAFAKGTRLCVVLADAHMTAIEEEMDVRPDMADTITAMELKEKAMALIGLPAAGQALIKHVILFQYSHERKVLDLSQVSSTTWHTLICAAADVQGDAQREIQFCEAVGVLTGQVRHGALGECLPQDGGEVGLQPRAEHLDNNNIWTLFAVLLQKGLLPGARACDGILPTDHSWKPTPADCIEGGSALLSGLHGRTDLNGQECRLIRWVDDAQRWAVELMHSGERVRVQPKNLSQTFAAYEGYAAGGVPLPRVPAANTGACWNCGVAPEDGATFLCCARCQRDKVVRVARYCSKACQVAAWSEHKQWHKQHAKGQALRVEHTKAHRIQPFVSLNFKEPWLQCVSRGNRAMHDGNFKCAAKEYQKAITLAPHEPMPYFELGVVYSSSGFPNMAGPAFVESMSLYSYGCQEWALAAASAIEAYTGVGSLQPDVRPQWMKSFQGLKENSLKIVDALVNGKAAPEASHHRYMGNGRVAKAKLNSNGTGHLEIADFKSRAWACRGAVLAKSNDRDELREAQQCYQNAADVLPADDPNRYMRVARAVQLRNVVAEFDAISIAAIK